MVNVQLTVEHFRYLRDAVKRDKENLVEMAPWDIDDQVDEYQRECKLCHQVGRLLDRVEQEQVITH